MTNPLSLQHAEKMLNVYMDAELKVLSGQEVEHDGKKWKRADLAAIKAGRKEWENKYAALLAISRGRKGPTLANFSD